MDIRKILLIEPPFYRLYKDTFSLDRYPLSLGYLGSAIKKNSNWDVMTYNADYYPNSERMVLSYSTGKGYENYLNNLDDLSGSIWDEIRTVIKEYKPTVVGLSAKSQNYMSATRVAKLTKEINKEITIIIGGPHSSMVGSEISECLDIDIAVLGEGEVTIVELLEALSGERNLGSVNGIIYRRDGKIQANPPREYIQDLDCLIPPYETAKAILKDFDKYENKMFQYLFAGRGCPYNCFFCGSREIWSRKVRTRSPSNIVKEIKGLQRMGLNVFYFDDDTFGIKKKLLIELCLALIDECKGIKWGCEIHINLIDEEIVELMKKAGCYYILIGVESGNNEMLKRIRKNISIEDAYKAVNVIHKYGIEAHALFMVGFPDETEETLNDTINAIRNINADFICYSIFTPYPGTEAFDYCKDNGLIDSSYNVSYYNHQSPANNFCLNISPDRMRDILAGVEKMVDRINWRKRIRRLLSGFAIVRLKEYGLRKSFGIFIRILSNK